MYLLDEAGEWEGATVVPAGGVVGAVSTIRDYRSTPPVYNAPGTISPHPEQFQGPGGQESHEAQPQSFGPRPHVCEASTDAPEDDPLAASH